MTKKEKQMEYMKIRNNTERRVRAIEKKTGIRLGIDYSKLLSSPKRYTNMYNKISVKNLTNNKLPINLIEAVQGTQTVGRKVIDPKTKRETFKIVKEKVTYEGEEARNLVKAAQRNFKIVGVRQIDIPKSYNKYLSKFKTKAEYTKWKNKSTSNAHKNIKKSMDDLIDHFKKNGDKENQIKAEAMRQIILTMGKSFVELLSSYDKEGYMIFFEIINIFDSDQDVNVWASNFPDIEEKFELYIPQWNAFYDLYKANAKKSDKDDTKLNLTQLKQEFNKMRKEK